MANIKIYGDLDSGSIFFINSTVDPKALGTVVASLIDFNGTDRILVQRNDRFQEDGISFRVLFKKLNPTRVCNQAGEELVSQLGYTTQQVVDYINGQSQLTGANGGDGNGTDVTGLDIDFKLDSTSTSIMLDNGFAYGVNTIKAIADADGTIHIVSELGDLTYFTKLDHTNVSIDGVSAAGGLNDVVNVLNELFTVGAFEQVVIADPYATMIADVNGVDTTITYTGNAIDVAGNDLAGSTASGYNNSGILSTETINQAGEYFTFDIRGEGTIGFGLVLNDIADVNGSAVYGDPTTFTSNGVNSGHYGYQFSHWFHPTPNGSWTNYGANTGYSLRSGWSGFPNRQNWLDGNPIKMRVGLDTNGYISIESYDPSTSLFVPHARTSYPIADGVEFKLGIKFGDTNARLYSLPKIHTLEDPAPTMYFRYIESPDGVFNYPLFATEEEAKYYDEIENSASTPAAHTHTYVDDATNTVWYMPSANHDSATMQHNAAPSGITFNSNAVTYTEITSLTDADLTPNPYVQSDLMYQEGTVVNLQVAPQGVTYTTSVVISPAGSGLVFNGVYLLQGTLADVSADTDYTVTVTRANAYGSSVGSVTITVTDVPVVSTNDTSWDKALDFSGSNEHLKIVNNHNSVMALRMKLMGTTTSAPSTSGYTTNDYYALPWATSIVFKSDNNNSNQHIWNSGEGASSNNDNIFLRQSSDGKLWFGWGRGSGNNEVRISDSLDSSKWYGVYIAHNGTRYSNPTTAQLVDSFDIRIMSTDDSFASVGSEVSTTTNWNYGTPNGYRLDIAVTGDFTIGGRGGNRNFHGKVASFVHTTLLSNVAMPTDAEIKLMITDPIKWLADFKSGVSYRYTGGTGGSTNGLFPSTFPTTDVAAYLSTQVWLMGDGGQDSYSNGIRNEIKNTDQNNTKLQLNSMVSNDIQTVSILGLS